MSLIEVQYDKTQLNRVRATLGAAVRHLPAIMSTAINRTADAARTDAARRIAKHARLNIGTIKKAIALRKATRALWAASLKVRGKRLPLLAFAARQTKRGVTYQIKPGGGRELVEHAFIAEMATGHRGVFIRKTKDGKMVPRLPIAELRGPSIGAVFAGAPGEVTAAQIHAARLLEKNVDSQVARVLARRAG